MDPTSFNSMEYTSIASQNVQMVNSGGGIHLWTFGVLVTFKALGNETGGSYSLFEDIVPPGIGPPAHIHTREEETWYLIDGELEWNVGGQTFQATKGSFIHLPRDVQHSFLNKSDKNAHMVLTNAPAGNERWFIEIGEPVADRYNPGEAPKVTPEYAKHALALAQEKYGVISVGSEQNH